MLPTGLESIAYNINRKNADLLFFEFGKIYAKIEGKYIETENLAFISQEIKRKMTGKIKVKKQAFILQKEFAISIFN